MKALNDTLKWNLQIADQVYVLKCNNISLA
jgi:hypothetical protein